MVENRMSVTTKEGVHNIDETNFVWGAKLTDSNYKFVTIHGELFALGDCVRCPLKSEEGHVGKITKLSQKEGRKMCRIRSFFSASEFPSSVKGWNGTSEPKELFLASGEGPNVEKDILLEEIAGRCIVLCTAEENFNEMPSGKQIEAADYFFRRGYDPANKEVVGLDSVEEAIGAQKLYNKKDWLVDKIVGRSSPQISASKMHCQSPASGLSSYQDATKGMYLSVPELSPGPSRDSNEQKLKKRKSNNLVAEPHDVDVVEKKKKLRIVKKLIGETSAVPTKKSNAGYEHLVLAIPAPSKIKSSQRLEVLPIKSKLPTSSTTKAKVFQHEGKSGSLKVSSSPIATIGSKKAATKYKVGADKERKNENMLSEETMIKLSRPGERFDIPAEREEPFKLQKGADGGIVVATLLVGSTQAGSKCGESKRQKNKEELLSEGTPNIIFKAAERSNASFGMENPCIFQKELDESTIIATPCSSRKIPSVSTLLTRKVLPVKKVSSALTLKPSVTKMDSNIPTANPLASKEVLQGDVDRMILKSDEDVPHATSTSHWKSSSQILSMSSKRRSLATTKDLLNVEQKPQGQIFKPKVEEWDISLVSAIQNNRVLLLKNLVAGLHSDELAEAFTQATRIRCEVRIVPPVSFAYQTTTALLKLPSAKKAQDFIHEIETKYVSVANRLVTATLFNYQEFKTLQLSKYPGHLEFSKEGRDFINEDYRNAVATSHFAQGNTIEFAFGLPWRVLDEQHEEQWRMLQEIQFTNSSEKVKLH